VLPWFLPHAAQTKEEMFWRGLRLDGLVIYDVGAFHGILTLFFASRCSQSSLTSRTKSTTPD